MRSFSFGKGTVSDKGPCYVIAEIGHNHQGNLKMANYGIFKKNGEAVNARRICLQSVRNIRVTTVKVEKLIQ